MSKNIPDPAPLEKAVAQIKQTQADIEDAKRQQVSIGKEVEDFLKTVDPRDTKAIQAAAGKKTHLEILPHFIERKEEELPGLHEKLCEEAARFARALAEAGCEENILLSDEVERRMKPFAPDGDNGSGTPIRYARALASHCILITSIPPRILIDTTFYAHVDSLKTSLDKVSLILEVYRQWRANDCRFGSAEMHKAVSGK
ncbi:MAG: hypothetical protein ABSE62_15980 [Chthoniobacteraceae bacterium]|jgi:hypothetical protein